MTPEDLELTLKILKASGARSVVYVSGDVRVEATFDPEPVPGSLESNSQPGRWETPMRPRFPTGNESLR